MGKYRCVLFDFDGTLFDTEKSVIDSVRYSLEKRGIYESDYDKLKSFIGPPLTDSFKRVYGFSKEKTEEAVKDYRKVYQEKNMLNVSVYHGVPETLETLKKKGIYLAVASSKPFPMLERILKTFDMEKYFDSVFGATLDGRIAYKDEVIREAISAIKDKYPDITMDEILMVGDRKYDAEGAKVFGIKCVGVTYGMAQEGELEAAGCIYIINYIKELLNIV